MRLLLFGGWGQLGTELAEVARGHEVARPVRAEADVTDAEAVLAAVRAHRPQAVIDAAAFHQVDRCEREPSAAFAVNALGAINVARAAREVGARTVYVSTDYVFDGTKGEAYAEDDRPAPVNVYGLTKEAGERGVRLSCPDHLVVRLSGLFGHAGSSGKGGNFVETVLSKAAAGEPLSVVSDQRLSPTSAADAAVRLLWLLERSAPPGTYHLVNRGSCSWYEFARAVLYAEGIDTELTPKATSPDEVRRPPFSVLADTRTAALGLPQARSWRAALDWYLSERENARLRRSPR
ncbi:MAG TPA: dTDP-4-dehydrorhamnose reductase [Actinomycetota bacterium]|nr:dTDP-4-dehydrorhamnose reductase [Actinomycetota bacterium]